MNNYAGETRIRGQKWEGDDVDLPFVISKKQRIFAFPLIIDINRATAYNTIRRGRFPDKILFAP